MESWLLPISGSYKQISSIVPNSGTQLNICVKLNDKIIIEISNIHNMGANLYFYDPNHYLIANYYVILDGCSSYHQIFLKCLELCISKIKGEYSDYADIALNNILRSLLKNA